MSDALALTRQRPFSFPRTRRVNRVQAIFTLLLLALFSSSASAVTIRAVPDRDPLAMNETFNLVFSTDEKPDDDPDFSPLEKDFEILSQSQGSQVSIVNGRISRKTEWTLTLAPRQTGTLTIPAVSFGSDRSEAITVTVQAATEDTGSAEVLLEVQAEPKNPYVQAQVRYTVRVLRRVNFSGADLSEPVVHDALLERLGEDRSYTAERRGQRYAVIERQYAVFPQKSGPLKIEPVTLQAQIPGNGRSRFNSLFGQGTRIARVQSKAVELNVRPIPPAFTGEHWLPAENLELSESWSHSPPQTAVGEPITRTLGVTARGATVGVLPELDPELSRTLGGQAKLYPDQPALNEEKRVEGIVGSRQEKTAILPAQPGTIALPAIEIPWWNTRADRMEIARLPARTLTVTGTAVQTVPPTPAPQELAPVPRPAEVTQGQGGLLTVPLETRSPELAANPWFWSSLTGFLGWLGTAVAWWISRRAVRSPRHEAVDERLPGLRAATKALQNACESNEPTRARDALLIWARARWPQDPPRHLAAIAERAGPEFGEALRTLERTLYGHSPAPWNGAQLSRLLATQQANSALQPATARDLEPLYRS